MNKELMIKKIQSYLSDKYEFDLCEFDKEGVVFVKLNKNKFIKLILIKNTTLILVSEDLYDVVYTSLKDKNIYEIFEFPYIYGQSIYYIPNLDKLNTDIEFNDYDFKLFDGNTNNIELNSGFENAITFENNKCISDIAYVAYDKNKIIGVSGADRLSNEIWEVGIEVLPEYRNKNIATFLTKTLTLKILEKEIVPIWCASVSNIGSQNVATNSGYSPLWLESFGNVFDEIYPFKDLIIEKNNK